MVVGEWPRVRGCRVVTKHTGSTLRCCCVSTHFTRFVAIRRRIKPFGVDDVQRSPTLLCLRFTWKVRNGSPKFALEMLGSALPNRQEPQCGCVTGVCDYLLRDRFEA